MTSEVVVMNRLGIALASDSTATVRANGKPKFFHADKLFMLSNFHPVGVMVYNNSSLMGVPWEVIFKIFRARLSETNFPKLEDYAKHLIDFLTNNAQLFPADVQEYYYKHLIRTFFMGISGGIEKRLKTQLDEAGELTRQDLEHIPSSVVREALEEWRSKLDATCFAKNVGAELKIKQSGLISDLAMAVFKGLQAPVLQKLIPDLYELAKLVVQKDEILKESLSGIVIAGYGEEQHFPVMQQYETGGIFEGELKHNLIETWSVSKDVPSVIKPFAQSAMAQTFLEGISPKVEVQVVRALANAVMQGPDAIIDGFPGVSKGRKSAYKEQIRDATIKIAREAIAKVMSFKELRHRMPILQSVVHLPKKELAHVAASLVTLSSFQKRMTAGEDETVGGPIDVAVISKGDGFVWIDRKHYFKPEFNEHFFRNRPTRSRRGAKADDQDKQDQDGRVQPSVE